MIEDGEVRRRLAFAQVAQALVHRAQVIQHDIRAGQIAQVAQHVHQLRARHPHSGQAIAGRLERQRVIAETGIKLPHDLVIAAGCRSGCGCGLSHVSLASYRL